MAGKTQKDDAAPGNGSGLMGLVVKACYGLGLICLTVLFLAAVDFHAFDLTHSLGIPALAALALLLVCTTLGGIAAMLANGHAAARNRAENEALAERLEARMRTVESEFSAHLGAETQAIKKHRDELAAELEQLHQAEEDRRQAEEQRRLEDYEQLKRQNLLLQEHLRKAGQAMAATMTGTVDEDALDADEDDGDEARLAEAI